MIRLKSEKEIVLMKEGGKILADVMEIILRNVKTGVRLLDLDYLAEKEIRIRGGEPSFRKVKGYHWTICSCVNDVVVHGIPDNYVIKDLDVVGIDCGVYYKGFHTDSAWTVRVKDKKTEEDQKDKFLDAGRSALKDAIQKVVPGNHIYDISATIQNSIESENYSVVKTLVGHGIGQDLHEEPEIPGVILHKREKTPLIKKGMVLAIEIIYNMGSPDIRYRGNDQWTIITKDGKISGLFEATVAATSHGCVVLTKNYGTSGNS